MMHAAIFSSTHHPILVQTGKTSISTDAIINQRYTNTHHTYNGIAEKASSICHIFLALIRRDAASYLTPIYASASSSGLHQFLCAYSGSALSEFFMLTHELPSFLILDDLSHDPYWILGLIPSLVI